MKIGQNAPAQGKLLQMEAIEATVCRKGSIRQDSAYSGSIIAYGGFAWLPRQRKQIRQVTWQRRTWKLERGGWNQATKNMEAGTWRLGIKQPRTWRLERGGWNQATKNMEAGTWMPVPESRNLEPGSGYLPNPSHPKSSVPGLGGAQHQQAAEGCFKTPAAGRAFR